MTKKETLNRVKDLLIQSVLIIFSVILALVLNETRTSQNTNQSTRQALEKVVQEIQNNRQSLAQVKGYHKFAASRIDSLLRLADPTKPVIKMIEAVMPKGIQPPDMQQTAWNTFNSTGLVSNLDYDKIYTLTRLYKLQAEGVETTWKACAGHIMSPGFFDVSKMKTNLQLLQVLFYELYQQERFLEEKMMETLDEMGATQVAIMDQ